MNDGSLGDSISRGEMNFNYHLGQSVNMSQLSVSHREETHHETKTEDVVASGTDFQPEKGPSGIFFVVVTVLYFK